MFDHYTSCLGCTDLNAYPSDLTDQEWKVIEPLVPKPKPGRRPPKHPRRMILNAIFYLKRTGCQWRLRPTDFPPRSTVFEYFAAYYDAGKKVRGSKRPVVVDTLGLSVTSAAFQDRAGAASLLSGVDLLFGLAADPLARRRLCRRTSRVGEGTASFRPDAPRDRPPERRRPRLQACAEALTHRADL